MKTLNKTASAVLDRITDGLKPGETRTLDNAPGNFMAVHVVALSPGLFRVGHYFEQNGDLVPDPETLFLRQEVGGESYWLPVETRFAIGSVHTALVLDEQNRIKGACRGVLDDAVSFTNLWMKNIRYQQCLVVARAA
jgi:hypothetical protein